MSLVYICEEYRSVNARNCFSSTDVDECSAHKHDCDKTTQSCRNIPGSFTCDCKKGFTRDGDRCVKKEKKGKKRTQKNTKIEEELDKGNYFPELQTKIGVMLYAVFFAFVVAAVIKRSRLTMFILTLVYGFVFWYLKG